MSKLDIDSIKSIVEEEMEKVIGSENTVKNWVKHWIMTYTNMNIKDILAIQYGEDIDIISGESNQVLEIILRKKKIIDISNLMTAALKLRKSQVLADDIRVMWNAPTKSLKLIIPLI